MTRLTDRLQQFDQSNGASEAGSPASERARGGSLNAEIDAVADLRRQLELSVREHRMADARNIMADVAALLGSTALSLPALTSDQSQTAHGLADDIVRLASALAADATMPPAVSPPPQRRRWPAPTPPPVPQTLADRLRQAGVEANSANGRGIGVAEEAIVEIIRRG